MSHGVHHKRAASLPTELPTYLATKSKDSLVQSEFRQLQEQASQEAQLTGAPTMADREVAHVRQPTVYLEDGEILGQITAGTFDHGVELLAFFRNSSGTVGHSYRIQANFDGKAILVTSALVAIFAAGAVYSRFNLFG